MPRKKIVPVETEAQQAAKAEITTASALEQFRQDNDIRHSPEDTAETELEEVLSEEDETPTTELHEEATAEEEIESESPLHETVGFLPTNGQSQGMTHEMLTLFNGAQYAGTVLTGRLTGVERIPLGIVANVSYNKNDGTLNHLNGVTVKINADKMGLRMDLIRRGITERNERIGLHPSEEMFETQVRNYQFRFLRKMLGAKIDFVTEDIVEDANTVVGNRERAMERMRANFTPQRGRERARYVKGDNILSRVLRVSDNALVVEASGYEVAMTVRQVTPMAVVLPEIFKPGDNFPVIVTGVSDTGISLIGAQGARINIFQKVH
ncbi:MAG: hypothetical protein UHG68_06085, partial [Clostridia bacterium]|nr:hypothetical protein [Clostridia bacterium]